MAEEISKNLQQIDKNLKKIQRDLTTMTFAVIAAVFYALGLVTGLVLFG